MKPLIMVVLFLLVFAPPPPSALAESKKHVTQENRQIGKGLLVTPLRLEFKGRERSKFLKILNTDQVANTYRISFIPLIEKDQGKDASRWLRYSPRRVKVRAGGHQTIRMVVKKPKNLKPGIYTARIKVRAIPPPRKKYIKKNNEIAIKLDFVYAISIPIIIHHQR